MEDRRGSGHPKLRASVVKTEHEADAHHQTREVEEVALPIRVKKEEISEVPLKVPRFQYVDFPSLHQCIQQLTVPPLDNWLETCPLGRPSGRIVPVSAKERVPKFKYVDFPSLHHCMKQLSVPSIESWSSGLARPEKSWSSGLARPEKSWSSGLARPEKSWSSGLARPERGSGESDGLGCSSLYGSSAPTLKQEKYTAFPFPGPGPDSIACLTTTNQAPHMPQLPVCPSSRPKDSRVAEALQTKTMSPPDSQSKQPTDKQISCFSVIKHEIGTGSLAETNTMSALDDGVVEVRQDNPSLQTHPPQTQAELSDSLGRGEELWRTIPESVCPFCQKMFSDPEESRIHQRSHQEGTSGGPTDVLREKTFG